MRARSDARPILNEVGRDYMKVGQQATTLSGGMAQRVKLAKERSKRSKRSTGQTLYILNFGGEIVAEGVSEKASYTGGYLKGMLGR